MSSQVKQSIKDIVPTLPDPIPQQLILQVDSIYKQSQLKIPVLPKAEFARHTICAFFAVDMLKQTLELPEPLVDKIAVAPRQLSKIFDDFRELVFGLERLNTPKGSPRKSPVKKAAAQSSVPLTPKGKANLNARLQEFSTPKRGSPLKKLQLLADETPKRKLEAAGFSDVDSPFNPKLTKKVPATPKRSTTAGSESPFSTPSSPSKSKRIVTIPDLIAFANHFFIPASITPQLILSFGKLRQKFAKKNEWLLVCGMIHTTYIRINHQILSKKIGSRSQFEDQLFQYQKGGLMKWNMLIFCTIVSDMLKNEYWLIDLERQFSSERARFMNLLEQEREDKCKLGEEVELRKFGAMIDASVMFGSASQEDYFDTWKQKVIEKIKG